MSSKELEEIYSKIPPFKCKGLCQMACGPILMSDTEQKVILDRYGSLPTTGPELTCSKLVGGKCSIYEDRPMICRLFGIAEGMRCPFGCVPLGGMLPDRKARKLLRRIIALDTATKK